MKTTQFLDYVEWKMQHANDSILLDDAIKSVSWLMDDFYKAGFLHHIELSPEAVESALHILCISLLCNWDDSSDTSHIDGTRKWFEKLIRNYFKKANPTKAE